MSEDYVCQILWAWVYILQKLHIVKVGAFVLGYSVKIRGLKDEKLIRKQIYTKTEAYKLYSGVFWIFLPKIIKIDPYNFEIYFETVYIQFQSLRVCWDTVHIDDRDQTRVRITQPAAEEVHKEFVWSVALYAT